MKNLICAVLGLFLTLPAFAQLGPKQGHGTSSSSSSSSTNLTGNALAQVTNIAQVVVGQSNGQWIAYNNGYGLNTSVSNIFTITNGSGRLQIYLSDTNGNATWRWNFGDSSGQSYSWQLVADTNKWALQRQNSDTDYPLLITKFGTKIGSASKVLTNAASGTTNRGWSANAGPVTNYSGAFNASGNPFLTTDVIVTNAQTFRIGATNLLVQDGINGNPIASIFSDENSGSYFALSDFASGGLLANLLSLNDNILIVGNVGNSPGFVDELRFQLGSVANNDLVNFSYGTDGGLINLAYLRAGRYQATSVTTNVVAVWVLHDGKPTLTNSPVTTAQLAAMPATLVTVGTLATNAIPKLNGFGDMTTLSNCTVLTNFWLGPNTNFVLVVSNSSATGPGMMYLLRLTNGVTSAVVLAINGTNGNVGIGTATPAYPLEATGTIHTAAQLIIGASPSTAATYSVVASNSLGILDLTTRGNNFFELRYIGGTKLWELYSPSSDSWSFYSTAKAADVLTVGTNGNVGIGTTTPTAVLHVVGNTKFYSGVMDLSGGPSEITLGAGQITGTGWGINKDVGITLSSIMPIHSASTFYFSGAGNNGIGTATPGYGLHVASGSGSWVSSNAAPFALQASPTAVVLATSWTNTYLQRITVTVDGTLNMAVGGSSIVTLTNLTTAESHVIAGSTVSIAGATYFSYPYEMSTNEVIQVIAANTGTATTTLTQTTVKRK